MKVNRLSAAVLLTIAFLSSLNIIQAWASDCARNEIEEKKVTTFILPLDVFSLICEYLDPISLKNTKFVTKVWNDNINSFHKLFLPIDDKARKELIAQNNFADLFRRASNTRNGVAFLADYPGFFPSHFLGVYPFNSTVPEDEENKKIYQRERLIYTALLKDEIPEIFLKADQHIIPDDDEIELMDAKALNNFLDALGLKLPRLKLLRVVDKEAFKNIITTFSADFQPGSITRLPLSDQIDNEARYKVLLWNAYVQSLDSEELSGLVEYVFSDYFEDYSVNLQHNMLPALNYLLDKVLVDQKTDRPYLATQLVNFHLCIEGIDKTSFQDAYIILFREKLKKAFSELISEDSIGIKIRLRIHEILELHYNYPCCYSEFCVTAAKNNIYDWNSLNSLCNKQHPLALDGAVNLYTLALEELKETGYSYLPNLGLLSILTNSKQQHHINLAANLVIAYYKLNGTESEQIIAIENNGWHGVVPLRSLIKKDVEKTKLLMSRYIVHQNSLLKKSDFRSVKKLLQTANYYSTLFYDDASAIHTLDEVFAHISKLPLNPLCQLTESYFYLNVMDKANQCLSRAKEVLKNEGPEQDAIVNLALANAKMGYLDESRELFILASEKLLNSFSPFMQKDPLTTDEIESLILGVIRTLLPASILEDMTFLRSQWAPILDQLKKYKDDRLYLELIYSYTSDRVGLKDYMQFFLNRLESERFLLSRKTDVELFEIDMDLKIDQSLKMTKENLYEHFVKFSMKAVKHFS